jgi:hypothetical protein
MGFEPVLPPVPFRRRSLATPSYEITCGIDEPSAEVGQPLRCRPLRTAAPEDRMPTASMSRCSRPESATLRNRAASPAAEPGRYRSRKNVFERAS